MVAFFALLLACSTGTPLEEEHLTVACGLCIYGQSSNGCYWAAKVDDEIIPVTGPGIPMDHKPHAPGGMCTMEREAVVTGTRYDDKIMADAFELVPVSDPSAAPAHEHAH